MAAPCYVQGIFDSSTRILTIGLIDVSAYRVSEKITKNESDIRLKLMTRWARKNALITKHGVIAEI